MTLTCRRATGAQDLELCLAIRHAVFVEGQGVPIELEQDGQEERCLHYLCFADATPVATARVMPLEGKLKLQRVAVLDAQQGKGVGATLMRFMMNDLASDPVSQGRNFFLSSQVSAIPFYEKLGFETCSGIFLDAGIEHRDMKRSLGG